MFDRIIDLIDYFEGVGVDTKDLRIKLMFRDRATRDRALSEIATAASVHAAVVNSPKFMDGITVYGVPVYFEY